MKTRREKSRITRFSGFNLMTVKGRFVNRPFCFFRAKIFVFFARFAYVQKTALLERSTMKKIFALFLITLFCACFAFSQEENKPAANWQTFAPANEEFLVETPVPLNASIVKLPEKDKNTPRRYQNSLDGTYFFVFSDNLKNPAYLEMVQKFVKSYNQKETVENLGNFDGLKFAFSDNEDFYHTILIVRSQKRVYTFQTISPTKENAAVERFFSSLKFEAKPDTEKTVESSISSDLNLPAPDAQNRRFPVGSGYGSGTGSGFGRGNAAQATPETKPSTIPANVTSGVKILSKPRANYTDFARWYQITGKVALRVTFSADGTIGAISTASKLPFGLTQEALTAAKGITFEPAMREGTPYSVTKMVEYGFSIY
jgi:hypothetical protein